ncbi:TonB-dependent receptor [Algoriphagus machipongonensis]|uniref:Uncharacterized protein n=1 Tax=Algoriphagus machipongonensis TaxID=388413 RepID=E2RUE8_9BACT|nr:TonB-dependent receptor plug domain-containing protein [Algoriphagus machipongonensis]EFQ79219.1 hypothetical protein ALPR1_21163 [Algoriphagus machipongonensis]
MKEFFDSPTNYRIVGAARFEEMKPESEEQRTTWENNRAEIYRKSPMNMFRAMITGTQEQEGFYLYGDKAGGSASRNMRSDIFANELGNSVVPYKPDQLVRPADQAGEYLINMKGRIEIHYQKGYSQVNTYRDAPYPVSWLEVTNNTVRVDENGMILNPQDLVFSGDMDTKRISTLLPLDYDAEKAIQLQNLDKTAANYQEKVYVHTDKPYYYAGDEIFFKAYFNYGNKYLREELSSVLHLELINSNRDYILEKKLQIRDGVAVGNFVLPDSLSQENYYLRAYTNWQKNYGPDHYYMQPLSILSPYQRVVEFEEEEMGEPKGISLKSDKETYGKREKVTLTIKASSESQKALAASLSVAVLDQEQIVPISTQPDIFTSLKLEDISSSIGLDRFSYPVEKAISLRGFVTDDKGKPTATDVTAFVNNFEGLINLESDRKGEFLMEDMEFYGPLNITFQATDKKGKPAGKVQIIDDLKAPIALPANPYFPKKETVQTPIRPVIEEEITEAEDDEEEDKESTKEEAIYGKPDYVVEGDKLMATGNTVDLVNSLAGNVPGMRVTVAGVSGKQQIRLRGGAMTLSGSMEPIVMVNNTIMVQTGGTTAADNLRNINVDNIDRVEIVNKTVSMLGDQGRNGVISVYLKEYKEGGENLFESGKGMNNYTIEGYTSASSFYQVDYEQENDPNLIDQRQTLYWNPYLVTDENGTLTFSFYTNDNGGPMTVYVRGLGVNGEPLSGTFTINPK